MTVEEISAEIGSIEQNVDKSGADNKFMLGLIARGVWEVARQIAEANAAKAIFGEIR